jgi:surface antigen
MEQRVAIAGQRVRAIGTICRNPDGRWALTF